MIKSAWQQAAGEASHLRLTIKGVFSRAAFIQHDTCCPDIALLIVRPILTKLRRQIVGRANHRLGKACVGAHVTCNPQITNFGLPFPGLSGNEDVLAAWARLKLNIYTS